MQTNQLRKRIMLPILFLAAMTALPMQAWAQEQNYWSSAGIRADDYANALSNNTLEIASAAELGLLAYELTLKENVY